MAKRKGHASLAILNAMLEAETPLTQNDLGGLIDAKRETVRLALRRLSEMKLVCVKGAKPVQHRRGLKAMLWDLHPRVRKQR